jgi:protein-S-isoprenylcysteine O-methyltransferase Ste14
MRITRGIGSFLLTLAIYLGLPLIGWGPDDWHGFGSLPQRFGYAITIVAFGLVAGYEMIQRPEALRGGKGEAGKFVPRQRIVRLLVTGMLLAALVLVPFADRRGIGVMAGSPAARWLGLVLATAGMVLIFWSGWALGRLYSPEVTIQKNHRLITDGPYHHIRHPRYLGGMMQGIGLSLLFRSWIGLILTGLFVAIVLFRISDEEALMRREFGPEWQAYCARSWRLLPGIW